jgi:hypothetical protein
MQVEKDRVLKAIISYRECFDFFKNVGLYTPGKTHQRFPADVNNPFSASEFETPRE